MVSCKECGYEDPYERGSLPYEYMQCDCGYVGKYCSERCLAIAVQDGEEVSRCSECEALLCPDCERVHKCKSAPLGVQGMLALMGV